MDKSAENTAQKKFEPVSMDETILVDESGSVYFMNESACELFGYGVEENFHGCIQEILPDISLSEMEKGKIFQHYGKHKNGSTFPLFMKINTFILQGERYFLLVFYDEVTEYKRVVEELKKSMQELMDLKFALDESSIVAITNEKGVITYVNDQFCQISKYERSELIGQDHEIVNSGYHSKDFFREMWRTIGSGKVWQGEIRNRAKDGTIYWVDTTIVPFLNEKGRPYQYLAIRYEITERKHVEEELQKMMTKIIDIQEEERKRLSRNLHDGIGQNLYGHLITINRLMSEVNHPLLDQMQLEATQLIEEVREISWELRPSVLDDLGLVPAIRSFLTRFSDHYGIDVYFECVLNERLDINTETTIYRVIQEALTNVRKYAEVEEATVTIREADDVIRVMVEDRGIGFPHDGISRGVGLFSMEERARSVGGELHIRSTLGKGTKVILEVTK